MSIGVGDAIQPSHPLYLEIRGSILNNFHRGDVMEEDNKLMCEKLTGVPVIACVGKNDTDIDISEATLKRICYRGEKK